MNMKKMFGDIGREKDIDFKFEILSKKRERRDFVIFYRNIFFKGLILSNFFQQLFYLLLWLFSLC